MNKADQEIVKRIVALINSQASSEPEVGAIFDYIQKTRGAPCAHTVMTIISLWRGRPDAINAGHHLETYLETQPVIKASSGTSWQVQYFFKASVVLLVIVIILVVLEMLGIPLPPTGRFLVSLLTAGFASALVMAGGGTADVKGQAPDKVGGKFQYRLGGAVGAFFVIFFLTYAAVSWRLASDTVITNKEKSSEKHALPEAENK
jgi:hypothetical protein